MSQGMSNHVLDILAATIKARRNATLEDSYTKRLLAEPIKPAKKVGEEGVEVALAAVAEDKPSLIGETADLLYHLLVVLESRDVTLDEVYAELERRMAASEQQKQRKAASA
jgi:phosphoribosyl-ATP pyrophosphohydrolase